MNRFDEKFCRRVKWIGLTCKRKVRKVYVVFLSKLFVISFNISPLIKIQFVKDFTNFIVYNNYLY